MTAKKPLIPPVQKPDETARIQEFSARYGALCQEYGLVIQSQIFFKQQIDGTFTIGAQLGVVPLKAEA